MSEAPSSYSPSSIVFSSRHCPSRNLCYHISGMSPMVLYDLEGFSIREAKILAAGWHQPPAPQHLPPLAMEDSKLQRLHDTLKKLAPKGNHVSTAHLSFSHPLLTSVGSGSSPAKRCNFLHTSHYEYESYLIARTRTYHA